MLAVRCSHSTSPLSDLLVGTLAASILSTYPARLPVIWGYISANIQGSSCSQGIYGITGAGGREALNKHRICQVGVNTKGPKQSRAVTAFEQACRR